MDNTQTAKEGLTESLPETRVTPTMRKKLQQIANQSISNRMSDHVRLAVQLYIERHERSSSIYN